MLLLIGRRELMPDVNNNNDLNAIPTTSQETRYLQNFWVKVDYQTGHVSVTELSRYDSTQPTPLMTIRRFAQQGQSTGGR